MMNTKPNPAHRSIEPLPLAPAAKYLIEQPRCVFDATSAELDASQSEIFAEPPGDEVNFDVEDEHSWVDVVGVALIVSATVLLTLVVLIQVYRFAEWALFQ